MDQQRESWPDAIRAVACLMVIILHSSVWYVVSYGKIPLSDWMSGNIVDSFVRPCVPLFFMISGYIFLGEKKVKAKNILRILYCLLFYSALCIIYMLATDRYNPTERILNILSKPVFYHLWFFYTLVGCYILFSFLKVRDVGKYSAITLLLVVFVLLNPFTSNLFKFIGVRYYGTFLIDGGFIYNFIYCVLGYFFGRMDTKRIGVLTPVVGYFIFSMLTAYFIYLQSDNFNKYVGTFYSGSSPFVMGASLCIFIFLKNYYSDRTINPVIKLISGASLPIYGVHALVLDYFVMRGYRSLDKPVLDMFLMSISVFLLSLLIVFSIKAVDRNKLVS